MPWTDIFTGRKAPPPGTVPQPEAAVRQAILALDRTTAPYTVRPAIPGEPGDITAEWRIVDASWYAIFAKAGLQKSYTIYLRLDPGAHEVRALDCSRDLAWSGGIPTVANTETRWGRQLTVEFASGYGFNETLQFGQVYSYRFNTGEIRGPLQAAVAAQGWAWRSVGLGGL